MTALRCESRVYISLTCPSQSLLTIYQWPEFIMVFALFFDRKNPLSLNHVSNSSMFHRVTPSYNLVSLCGRNWSPTYAGRPARCPMMAVGGATMRYARSGLGHATWHSQTVGSIGRSASPRFLVTPTRLPRPYYGFKPACSGSTCTI